MIAGNILSMGHRFNSERNHAIRLTSCNLMHYYASHLLGEEQEMPQDSVNDIRCHLFFGNHFIRKGSNCSLVYVL